jgi:hypothetical protein
MSANASWRVASSACSAVIPPEFLSLRAYSTASAGSPVVRIIPAQASAE